MVDFYQLNKLVIIVKGDVLIHIHTFLLWIEVLSYAIVYTKPGDLSKELGFLNH